MPVAPSPTDPTDPADARGPTWTLVLLGCLAVVASTAWCWHAVPHAYKGLAEDERIGAHLALGHGFRNPVDPSAHAPPSSWLPPLYPALVGAVYRAWGVSTPASLDVLLAVNVVSFGLLVVEAGRLAVEAFAAGPNVTARGRTAVAVMAAVAVLLYPTFALRSDTFGNSYPAVWLFAWTTRAALRLGRRRPTWAGGAALGVGLAVLALLNASYAATYPILGLLAIRSTWPRPRRLASAAPFVVAAGLAFAAVLTPWTVRNYRTFHQLFFVRGGLGLELWVGNQPGNTGWMRLDHHPSVDRAEGERMVRMGEPAYYQFCKERFEAGVRADPAAFARRTANRAAYVLVGSVDQANPNPTRRDRSAGVARVALDAVVLLAGLVGTALAWRRRQAVGAWLLPIGLAACAPFVVTHVSYRYVMPVRLTSLVAIAGVVPVGRRAAAAAGAD